MYEFSTLQAREMPRLPSRARHAAVRDGRGGLPSASMDSKASARKILHRSLPQHQAGSQPRTGSKRADPSAGTRIRSEVQRRVATARRCDGRGAPWRSRCGGPADDRQSSTVPKARAASGFKWRCRSRRLPPSSGARNPNVDMLYIRAPRRDRAGATSRAAASTGGAARDRFTHRPGVACGEAVFFARPLEDRRVGAARR